jgi:hypothetical protein
LIEVEVVFMHLFNQIFELNWIELKIMSHDNEVSITCNTGFIDYHTCDRVDTYLLFIHLIRYSY